VRANVLNKTSLGTQCTGHKGDKISGKAQNASKSTASVASNFVVKSHDLSSSKFSKRRTVTQQSLKACPTQLLLDVRRSSRGDGLRQPEPEGLPVYLVSEVDFLKAFILEMSERIGLVPTI
jgi:hypothetical protein